MAHSAMWIYTLLLINNVINDFICESEMDFISGGLLSPCYQFDL